MKPRRKRPSVRLLPTITEVQESVPHVYHTQTLDDYMDSIRGLSQPSCYIDHVSFHPQPCRQPSAKEPGLRRAKYPVTASSSSTSLALSPPPQVLTNSRLAMDLVVVSPESISLTLVPPRMDGKASWWPHQDPLSWLFTQSQGVAVAAATSLPLVENVPDSVCLV